MSDPFVFIPQVLVPGVPSPHHSPFIPGSPFLPKESPSPFAGVVPLPPIHPGAEITFDPIHGWARPGHMRTPSWNPPHSAAGIGDGDMLHPFGHRPRSTSFGGIGGQGLATPAPPPVPVHVQLNPLLDARNSTNTLWLDLSMSMFSPRMVVDQQGSHMPLSVEHLTMPATHPPYGGLRIVFDALPQYPIDVVVHGRTLTLGDVLEEVYRKMQYQIVQADYDAHSDADKMVIGKAYSRRCAALGAAADSERGKGVKRVDFLIGKVLFRGLLNDGTQLKAITA